ncbi:hypothetical protein CKQ90_32065, partial [Klebsiella pneumoniae]
SDNGHIRLSNLPEYLFSERPGGDSASSLLPASLTFSAIEKEAIITRPGDQRAGAGDVAATTATFA